jgi:hypothetical protein
VRADQVIQCIHLRFEDESEAKAMAGLDAFAEKIRKSLGGKMTLDCVQPATFERTAISSVSGSSSSSGVFGRNEKIAPAGTLASANYRITAPVAPNQVPQAVVFEIIGLLGAMTPVEAGRGASQSYHLEYRENSWTFGLANPEAQRAILLDQVRKGVDSDLAALGGKSKIVAAGMDKPLTVSAASDRDIRVVLPVTLSYEVQR